MITIKLATTHATLDYVFNHPSVYDYVTDDSSPPMGEFSVLPLLSSPYFMGMLAYDGDIVIGGFIFNKLNAISWEGHFCFLEGHRGEKAVTAAKLAVARMFDTGRCEKIVGNTPENNKAALSFVREVGFRLEGINRNSWLKGNKIMNQYITGMERGDL